MPTPRSRAPRSLLPTVGLAVLLLVGLSAAPGTAGTAGTVTGTPGPDLLIGTRTGDVVSARGGDDAVHSLAGPDDVRGGAGDDLLATGAGPDIVRDGRGDDVVRSGPGDDTVLLQRGADRATTGAGADTVIATDDETADDIDCGPDGDGVRDVVTYRGSRDLSDRLVNCELVVIVH